MHRSMKPPMRGPWRGLGLGGAAPAARICARPGPGCLRAFSTPSDSPLHVAVIGSGPAGFYTSDRLLHRLPAARVDMFEALPIPHGLVRFGVAPDHPEVKNVMAKFDGVAADPRYRFIGNARLGRDYHIADLRQNYNAVVLSYGASQDRLLNIPNESAKGVLGARAFVSWYNGAPSFSSFDPMLDSTDTAVIVGQGNVALDVARILLTPWEVLAKSDIAERAVEKLKSSRVRRVKIVGRRGPLEVSFTIKELRELLAIPSVSFLTDGPLLSRTLSSPPAQNLERPRKRLMQLLEKGTVEGLKDADKAWELDFFRSPREILVDSEGRVNGIALEVNEERTDGKAVGTGVVETVDCGLVFRSIGYRSVPVDGLPFDDRRGVVPNDKGRVTELPSIPEEIAKELGKDSPFNSFLPSPDPIPGLYVAGWLKRGPIGVIAQTMNDAHETAASIAADVEAGKLAGAKAGGDVLLQMLKDKGVRTVSYADWKRLEKWEEEQGKIRGKPREKVVDLDQALRIIDGLE